MLKDKIAEIEERRAELRALTQETLREAQDQAESGELEKTAHELADLLQVVKWTKQDFNEIDKESNASLVVVMDKMGTKKFEYGTQMVERKVSNYRKNWQNDSLIRSVVNTAMDEIQERTYVDQHSGEVVNERTIVGPFMEAVIDRLLECAAFRDWRVTALRHYIPGIDPDNFCDVERTTKAVISRS
tara:strand:+ start:24299 stop:24859 length:561 start_codon:yes stop_codon:yes gene_type:complete